MNLEKRYARARRTPFFYGWVIVGIAGLSIFFTGPGQTYSFTIFIDHILEEMQWSRTLISTLYSAATLVSGSLMFLVGRFVDNAGAKRSALLAASLLGLACIVNSLVFSPAILFIGFFLARFSGQGSLGLAAGTLPPRWFFRKRAFAIMLAGLGATVGSSIFPLLNKIAVLLSVNDVVVLTHYLAEKTCFAALTALTTITCQSVFSHFVISKHKSATIVDDIALNKNKTIQDGRPSSLSRISVIAAHISFLKSLLSFSSFSKLLTRLSILVLFSAPVGHSSTGGMIKPFYIVGLNVAADQYRVAAAAWRPSRSGR